ncbi:hypothetical protein WN51_03870 [Melipona quadrifasciata]|uniref:Uncharacterized protein n=1 Tax=Melipona quadrifasciata TaxID=166423 RepID=A0A0N0U7N7_9HYME|nr:hypothetical protein WN51_03870 [Melipona quadrifasciata]
MRATRTRRDFAVPHCISSTTGPCGAHRYAELPRPTLASPLSLCLPPLLQLSPPPPVRAPTTESTGSRCDTAASTTTP